MEFLYLDCFSGISGDMLLGGLLDLGASFALLEDSIAAMNINARLTCAKKIVQGIHCSAFQVLTSTAPPLRYLPQIEEILHASLLPEQVKTDALAVFQCLAEAEARVHGIDVSEVHFHEIGAVDTLVDIVGTFVCLNDLGISKVYSSPLPWPEGLITISHGRFPLPAPATAQLLLGFPCVHSQAGMELVTPTGAALLTQIACSNKEMPAFTPQAIGYGAGSRTRTDGVPNLLRIIRAKAQSECLLKETIAVLESEVDDLLPELFSHLYTFFMNHPGVLDFFTTSVFMKKNRPGNLITIIVKPEYLTELCQLLMRETGTLGVRCRLQERLVLPRSMEVLETPWGPVRIKQAQLNEGEIRKKPEYEDCQAIAVKQGIPLLDVYAAIQRLLARE
ncbi:MAG: nickel pincer cofactor biosynthesis protein LarC [Methanobacterium sp.]